MALNMAKVVHTAHCQKAGVESKCCKFIISMVMCNGVSTVCCNFGIKTKRACMLKHCVLLLTYVKKQLVKSALQHVFSLGWYLAFVGLGGSALWLNMGLLVAPTEVEGVWPVAVGAEPVVHLILALLVVTVEEQLREAIPGDLGIKSSHENKSHATTTQDEKHQVLAKTKSHMNMYR